MSSVVRTEKNTDSYEESGVQVELDRESWFSAESQRMLEDACDNPEIGPTKALATLLHHGLGLSLGLIGKLMGTSKNVVAKQVQTGTRKMRESQASPIQAG